jgi:hypothetical protein
MADAIGRMALRVATRYLRTRYRRQIRIGLGLSAVLAGIAIAYLAARDVPEG